MANDVIKVSTEDMMATVNRYQAEKAKPLNALQICVTASAMLALS